MCPATISASIMAVNMWKNSLKNVESDNNKILYEIIFEFFLQRNGTYCLNNPRTYEYVAERIAKDNEAYYVNSKLINLKFLKKNTKMKIHKRIIRPVFTYSSETWTLRGKDENDLRTFGRQILSKIFGPVNIDHIWRTRNNMETDEVTEGADIVRSIKAQRIK